MHDQRDRIVNTRLGLGQREVENALGFRIHAPRHIEPRQIDPGLGALIGLGAAGGGDKLVLPRVEIFALILAPLVDVENRPHRFRRALRADLGR